MLTRQRLLFPLLSLFLAISTASSGITCARPGYSDRGEKFERTSSQNNIVAGDALEKLTVGGTERSFIRHIPTGYDGTTQVPLVIVLHGRGGTGKGMVNVTGFNALADANKFIVVYPNGLGTPTVWNTGLSSASNNGIDDAAFLTTMLDKLEHNLKIDTKRVYCCGFSSGAIMSYFMGAKYTNRFAAIGIAEGTIGNTQNGQVVEIPTPSGPLPVIAFHGKKDQTIFYNGGGVFVDALPVSASIAFWVHADGCNATPQQITQQNGSLVIDIYNRCKDKNEVILYSFANGTHEWPSLHDNDQFDSASRMWEFFKNHPQP